nr:MAG TPA: hypothetical protein [Caudoviricetes sp.]DAS13333.1 MAG TPA: hypothetical protein [Caudoviricetes sp.]DAS54365.1 MAG TPA: hypothetical protein [Caudoviricetes sp.]
MFAFLKKSVMKKLCLFFYAEDGTCRYHKKLNQ